MAARDVGLVDGSLHWVRLAYLAPVSESAVLESPGLLLEYNNEVRRLIDPLVANFSTPALRSAALHMDGFGQLGALAGSVTPGYMVSGLLTGLTVSIPSTYAVLVVVTGSLLLPLYAMMTIALVVCNVLGFAHAFFGWQLGHSEAIAATICLGFAVDYCVHLCHGYLHSPQPNRRAKAADALATMGVTVTAGALTTAGSAGIMAGCQALVFSKMGVLIVFTTLNSLVYSLGFFAPLVLLAGPQGPTCCALLCRAKSVRGSLTRLRSRSSQSLSV